MAMDQTPTTVSPFYSRRCDYLKSRGTNIIHKLLAMARCSVHSRRLVSAMKEELSKSFSRPEKSSSTPLNCCTCDGYMTRPVCLPCGHSHCHLCLERQNEQGKDLITCSLCQDTHDRVPVGFETHRKPTLILQCIGSKYYPQEILVCCRERERGNEFAHEDNFQMAIEYYNKALATGNVKA